MTLAITHSTVVVVPDDGTSPVGTDEWNAAHTLTGTVSVAQGGTGTATALTQGSVVFAGASGVYSENNAKLFWNDANGRLGIGYNGGGASLYVYNIAPGTTTYTSTFDSNAADCFNKFISTSGVAEYGIFSDALYFSSFDNLSKGIQFLAGTFASAQDNGANIAFVSHLTGVVEQIDSTHAQSFKVYNTFTDASNYERGIFDWQGTSNVLTIGTEKLGTGSTRNLKFVVGGTNQLDFGITNAGVWTASGLTVTGSSGTGTGFFVVTNADTIGTGIDIGNTSAGGHRFQFFSTGSANGSGPGFFGVFDQTSSLTVLRLSGIDGSAQFSGTASTMLDARSNHTTGTSILTKNTSTNGHEVYWGTGGQLNHPGDVFIYDNTTVRDLWRYQIASLTWTVPSDTGIGWTNDTSGFNAPDVYLSRDAANTLAQRNSTTAQKFSVYNTYTNSSNYERAIFDWQGTSNVLTIGTQALGTGTVRPLRLMSEGALAYYSDGIFTAGNVFVGGAGNTSVSGTHNTAFGNLALSAIAGGSNNNCFGVLAGGAISSGTANFCLGQGALGSSTTADFNIAIGTFALTAYTDTGAGNGSNIGIGEDIWHVLTTGGSNTAIGAFATVLWASGSHNTVIGASAANAVTSGSNNTLIGGWTGPSGAMSSVIGFSDGAGNLKLDYGYTNAATWTSPAAICVTPVAVASLPTVGIAGRRHFVTDATATTFASIVAGGGANKVPVYDDGTNWRIG